MKKQIVTQAVLDAQAYTEEQRKAEALTGVMILHEQRQLAADLKSNLAEIDAIAAEWLAANYPDYAAMKEYEKEVRDRISRIESSVKTMAIAEYLEQLQAGKVNKKPYPGTGIRVSEGYEYNNDLMVQWCIENNLQGLLSVDPKQLEPVIKAKGPEHVMLLVDVKGSIERQLIPLVVETEKPTGTIASDLEKAADALAALLALAASVPDDVLEQRADEGFQAMPDRSVSHDE